MSLATTRARLLASTIITGLSLAGVGVSQAVAADAAAAPSTDTAVQEIVVTGSRIPTANLSSVSPITAVTSRDIKLQGATDIEDVLGQLPQTNGDLNNTPNPLSGSGGFTTVNLRGLGAIRTLVLIDGKRLMPGDPTLGGEAADLDSIPSILTDRIEVVTGGASAVYGSDAMAGVVNFIMKHDFEGVRMDVQYGGDMHTNGSDATTQAVAKSPLIYGPAPTGTTFDGSTINVGAMIGANTPDGKGNVTGWMEYRHQDPVLQGQRDYSQCAVLNGGAAFTCSGSSNSNLFFDENTGKQYSVSGTSLIPRSSANVTTPPYKFNSNPYEYLSKGDERYKGGFEAHYQINPAADVYGDFSFMDDRSVIHAAPSALFQQTFLVNCNNPLLSAQEKSVLTTTDAAGNVVSCASLPTGQATLAIGRRDIEGGARIYSYEHMSFRAVTGVRGDIGDGWHYDVYGQFGYTKYNYSVQNDLSLSRLGNALQVDPVTGACISGGDCVPLNIFKDGGVTAAALSYVKAYGSQSGDTQEQIADANITGDLGRYGIKSPFAKDGVGINFGAEYRRESLTYQPDEESSSGDLSGAGGASPAVSGAFNVKEVFAEARVPLAQDLPFIKDLSMDAGYRFSHYSSAGDVSAYKVAFEYAPTEDIRFRGSYQRAVRAPNINELFTPELVTNATGLVDPCAPESNGTVGQGATATLAQCMRTGVTAAQYGDGKDPATGGTDKIPQCPAAQCGTAIGGNPELGVEKSDTWSFGAVFTPVNYIKNLTFSVDYFNIDVTNAISSVPITVSLNNCLDSGLTCNLVVRQADGALFGTSLATGGYVQATNVNIGFLKTKGIDFAGNYRFDLDNVGLKDMGSVSLSYNATLTLNYIDEPVPGQGSYDCAGLFGSTCGYVPSFKSKLRITYNSPLNFTVSAQWRYTGSLGLETNTSQPLLSNGAQDTLDGHISAYSYFDISATYKIKNGLVIRAGVNNLLDKDPPILSYAITGSGTPNTYASYDLLGRELFIGLTADF